VAGLGPFIVVVGINGKTAVVFGVSRLPCTRNTSRNWYALTNTIESRGSGGLGTAGCSSKGGVYGGNNGGAGQYRGSIVVNGRGSNASDGRAGNDRNARSKSVEGQTLARGLGDCRRRESDDDGFAVAGA